MAEHDVKVMKAEEFFGREGQRYPFVANCKCGWQAYGINENIAKIAGRGHLQRHGAIYEPQAEER